MTKLRLGIIGSSSGNGHPYSWSAIFNGYDAAGMASCPYPSIPDYLGRQRFPEDAISEAQVTHVWTQDPAMSSHIAAAARIPNVVRRPDDMIAAVDGLLLARDDAENHASFAGPFLDAGLPVYIDKPLALDGAAARALFARQKYPGQIYTCSALVHARELQPTAADLAVIGRIRHATGKTVKDWDRYAVHVIDPVLRILGERGPLASAHALGDSHRVLDLRWTDGTTATFEATGEAAGSISIGIVGEAGRRDYVFADTFAAFKAALAEFVGIVLGRIPVQDMQRTLNVVEIIELGRRT